jgi:exonuclease III
VLFSPIKDDKQILEPQEMWEKDETWIWIYKGIAKNNTNDKNLSILNLNIRSLANKFDAFKNVLNSLNRAFSIISLTETWLNDQTSENFNLNNYNFVCSNKANRKGGGVGFYISNNLNYKLRTDLNIYEEGIIESLFIEVISTTSKNIILGNIYRPPSGNFEIFENKLNEILANVDKTKKISYLTGDFNIDLLKSDVCEYSNRFCEQLFTSSFFPLINKPTRITQHTATLIDNIFTNDLDQIESSINGLIYSDISDHLPIFHLASLSSNTDDFTEKGNDMY